MSWFVRYLGYLAAAGLFGVYVFLLVAGPQPITAIPKTREQLHKMEQENEQLRQEVQRRKEYLDDLEKNRSLQEREIRRGLNKQREGETTIYLPEAK